MPRFFVKDELVIGTIVALSEANAHHAARALRLRLSDSVILFNGRGGEYHGQIAQISRDRVDVAVDRFEPREVELPFRVTVAQGIAGGDKMDWTIEKAVELGAFAVQPLSMQRSVVRLSVERAAKRQLHWTALAQAACAQCGRNRVPEVGAVSTAAQWYTSLGSDVLRLILSPDASEPIYQLARPSADRLVVMLIGPEGGFSDDELSDAHAAGFQAVSLGPRVLRTETAAAAALAMLTGAWSSGN